VEKITIRPSSPADARDLHAMFQDEAVYSQTLQIPHGKLSLWERRLKDADESDLIHSIVAEVDGTFAGHATLMREKNPRRSHVAALGIAVGKEFQRQGVGRRLIQELINISDNWLGLHRLELEVFVDNTGAVALYESLGFVTEGRSVDHALRNGRYMDSFLMARIRPQ